ncbi:hypothetical protein V2G26_002046 [Clonostachys chloroleuca]
MEAEVRMADTYKKVTLTLPTNEKCHIFVIYAYMMQSSQCSCQVTNFQHISSQLEQDILPVDSILILGSEFTTHLKNITRCDRCIRMYRVTNMLMRITSRLVCFYEAAHANSASTQWSAAMVPSSSSPSSTSATTAASMTSFASQRSSHSGQSLHTRNGTRQGSSITSSETSADDDLRGYQSTPPHMRLGNLTLKGSEAQLLGQIALTDACLDLIEKLQEWKLAMDEKWEEGVHDEAMNGCLDRLAKLTGLLQFGGMTGDVSW